MERILVALDSTHTNINILGFACYMAEITRSGLTGAFIKDFNQREESVLNQADSIPYEEQSEFIRFRQSEDTINSIEENVLMFEDACRKRGIRHEVKQLLSARDLINESRFSDLIITDPQVAEDEGTEEAPSKFVRRLLSRAECPVIIAPRDYGEINEIIHCYDGSRSSVFAIKQFGYLLPELMDLKCTLLQVNKGSEWSLEEEGEMKNWMQSHYAQCGFEIFHGKVEDELFRYMKGKRNAFVTMGAYGRGIFSTMIKESRANTLIRSINLPIFISHE